MADVPWGGVPPPSGGGRFRHFFGFFGFFSVFLGFYDFSSPNGFFEWFFTQIWVDSTGFWLYLTSTRFLSDFLLKSGWIRPDFDDYWTLSCFLVIFGRFLSLHGGGFQLIWSLRAPELVFCRFLSRFLCFFDSNLGGFGRILTTFGPFRVFYWFSSGFLSLHGGG